MSEDLSEPEQQRQFDQQALTELRAHQRTFDGAYRRSAFGAFASALAVLRLFDQRFYKVGIVYIVLGILFFGVALLRTNHSHDGPLNVPVVHTHGTHNTRTFGPPFVTAGWVVVLTVLIVFDKYHRLNAGLWGSKDERNFRQCHYGAIARHFQLDDGEQCLKRELMRYIGYKLVFQSVAVIPETPTPMRHTMLGGWEW